MPSVNTFDVFDTLIARRCIEPRRLLTLLEMRAGLPGLANARQAADRMLGAFGKPYVLRDMWREVARTMGLDIATAERLLALEVEMEHEQVIPVVENLNLVKHGDLLVSDTYLPREVVLSLLRRVGLTCVVGLEVSNDGKFRGRVWPELLRRLSVREHLGDNHHSDGRTPSESGMRAVITTAAQVQLVERVLIERGWEFLAQLVREVRLANPYPPSRGRERYLWNLGCQLNFPLLFFASFWLERSATAVGAGELFFVSRDCLLWRNLYARLFPHRRSTYLYASRLCLLKPSEGYLEYFRGTWHAGGLIVDLASTGTSWSRLFARLGARGRCRFIGWADDSAYLGDGPRVEDWLDVEMVFRNSSAGMVVNKGVEMLNYAPHGLVEDVIPLPSGGALPVLAETLEYEASLPEAVHAAFSACVSALNNYPALLGYRGEPPTELIWEFVGFICADRQLGSIYTGHLEADLAYHQRILATE